MQSGRGNCTRTYVVMRMRGRGRRVDELFAKIRTVKISSGTSGGIFAEISHNTVLHMRHLKYKYSVSVVKIATS